MWNLPCLVTICDIGLRPENLFASGEPFCVGCLLSPWLRLVRPGGMEPCSQAPNKRPHTQNASLRYMRLDRRTHREHGVGLGATFFFCWCIIHQSPLIDRFDQIAKNYQEYIDSFEQNWWNTKYGPIRHPFPSKRWKTKTYSHQAC